MPNSLRQRWLAQHGSAWASGAVWGRLVWGVFLGLEKTDLGSKKKGSCRAVEATCAWSQCWPRFTHHLYFWWWLDHWDFPCDNGGLSVYKHNFFGSFSKLTCVSNKCPQWLSDKSVQGGLVRRTSSDIMGFFSGDLSTLIPKQRFLVSELFRNQRQQELHTSIYMHRRFIPMNVFTYSKISIDMFQIM